MKRVTVILTLLYFALGKLVLPLGDFSVLPDLPLMYLHCKATEHHDMNPLDFITDHLINIDGLFDAHDNCDEQKPHRPFPLHHLPVQSLFVSQQPLAASIELWPVLPAGKRIMPAFETRWHSKGFWARMLRPPILA